MKKRRNGLRARWRRFKALWLRYLKVVRPALGSRSRRVDDTVFEKARRILLVKRDNIGDAVLATTLFNLAYERWRDREVTVLCGGAARSLLEALYPGWSFRVLPAGEEKDFYLPGWKKDDLRDQVRALGRFDLAVNLRAYRFEREVIFDSWIDASHRVALSNQAPKAPEERIEIPQKRVYGRVIRTDESVVVNAGADMQTSREIRNQRALARALFPTVDSELLWPALNLPSELKIRLGEALRAKGAKGGGTLALCPFPSYDVRMYPFEKFAAVATALAKRHGLEVEILGSAADAARAEDLTDRIRAQGVVARNLAGRLELLETAVLLGEARLVLGVETGLPHMSVTFGVPTVVVIGGGHMGWFAPWGDQARARWLTNRLDCFQCDWRCTQAASFCITEVRTQDLERAGDELLSAAGNQ